VTVSQFGAAQAAVSYTVSLRPAGAHAFTVVTRIRRPDPRGQVVSLPAWIPGSYLVRDYARHVLSLEAECGGERVAVRKVDKSTWRAAPVAGELILRAEIYANDASVRGAQVELQQAFFNGCCLLFRVHGQEQEQCVLSVDPGDHAGARQWRLATAMPRLSGAPWDFGAFAAADYDELIDHPVLMGDLLVGEFIAGGIPHAVVLAGRHDADAVRLTQDLARLCGWQQRFFGGAAGLDRYLFLVRLTGEGFGGMEHRASTALVCHRDHLPRGADPGDRYREFLGVASHEYFHLWNIKRIRPAEFVPYRLDRENYTRQLWIFEGITSYYDDLALCRSGLVTVPQYLERLGRLLTAVYRAGGRRRQTLEDASFDAWIKFYRPDENAPNAHVSYYNKGAMVALALDLDIRQKTAGRTSLDTVMRVLWEHHGTESGRPLAEGAFEELVDEVTGLSFAEFFHEYVRSTVDPPVGVLLAQFGIRLHQRAAESGADRGGAPGHREQRPRPWLGIATRAVQGRLRITHVVEGGPAWIAGLAADDELVALDGLRLDAESYEPLLDRREPAAELRLQVFRRDELLEFPVRAAAPPRDTCYLTLDDAASAEVRARRDRWLGDHIV
jgi:predicted metalloprotease with PDZ domain